MGVHSRVPDGPKNKLREKRVSELLQRLWHEEQGQDLVEYGLIAVLIVLAAVAGMGFLANVINNKFFSIGSDLETPAT